jgi:hypothetical protein
MPLLIGGENDGRRIEWVVDGRPSIVVPCRPDPLEICRYTNAPPIDYHVHTEVFRRVDFAAGPDRFIVYVLSGMDAADALYALISKYPDNSGPTLDSRK